jgi:hypothetical protein
MAQAKMKQTDIPKHSQVIEEHPSSGHEEDHDHGHALSWREINRVCSYITAIGVICTFVGGSLSSRSPAVAQE